MHHSGVPETSQLHCWPALALVVLCRQDSELLFVIFRPEKPSGFDSGGLRLASEVKRVRTQIEFLTNFNPEESQSSHTKPALPGQPWPLQPGINQFHLFG
jgi:hypothetical protein